VALLNTEKGVPGFIGNAEKRIALRGFKKYIFRSTRHEDVLKFMEGTDTMEYALPGKETPKSSGKVEECGKNHTAEAEGNC